MRTHYDVEQDDQLLGSRQTRRRTAWTMAIRLSKERPEARWRVVPCDGSLCRVAQAVGRRLGDPPALRMWMLVVPLPVLYIYLYACKVLTLIYLSSLLLFRC